MFRLWEYDVAEDCVDDFARAYGADGAWARLFAVSSGFEGLTVDARELVGPDLP